MGAVARPWWQRILIGVGITLGAAAMAGVAYLDATEPAAPLCAAAPSRRADNAAMIRFVSETDPARDLLTGVWFPSSGGSGEARVQVVEGWYAMACHRRLDVVTGLGRRWREF